MNFPEDSDSHWFYTTISELEETDSYFSNKFFHNNLVSLDFLFNRVKYGLPYVQYFSGKIKPIRLFRRNDFDCPPFTAKFTFISDYEKGMNLNFANTGPEKILMENAFPNSFPVDYVSEFRPLINNRAYKYFVTKSVRKFRIKSVRFGFRLVVPIMLRFYMFMNGSRQTEDFFYFPTESRSLMGNNSSFTGYEYFGFSELMENAQMFKDSVLVIEMFHRAIDEYSEILCKYYSTGDEKFVRQFNYADFRSIEGFLCVARSEVKFERLKHSTIDIFDFFRTSNYTEVSNDRLRIHITLNANVDTRDFYKVPYLWATFCSNFTIIHKLSVKISSFLGKEGGRDSKYYCKIFLENDAGERVGLIYNPATGKASTEYVSFVLSKSETNDSNVAIFEINKNLEGVCVHIDVYKITRCTLKLRNVYTKSIIDSFDEPLFSSGLFNRGSHNLSGKKSEVRVKYKLYSSFYGSHDVHPITLCSKCDFDQISKLVLVRNLYIVLCAVNDIMKKSPKSGFLDLYRLVLRLNRKDEDIEYNHMQFMVDFMCNFALTDGLSVTTALSCLCDCMNYVIYMEAKDKKGPIYSAAFADYFYIVLLLIVRIILVDKKDRSYLAKSDDFFNNLLTLLETFNDIPILCKLVMEFSYFLNILVDIGHCEFPVLAVRAFCLHKGDRDDIVGIFATYCFTPKFLAITLLYSDCLLESMKHLCARICEKPEDFFLQNSISAIICCFSVYSSRLKTSLFTRLLPALSHLLPFPSTKVITPSMCLFLASIGHPGTILTDLFRDADYTSIFTALAVCMNALELHEAKVVHNPFSTVADKSRSKSVNQSPSWTKYKSYSAKVDHVVPKRRSRDSFEAFYYSTNMNKNPRYVVFAAQFCILRFLKQALLNDYHYAEASYTLYALMNAEIAVELTFELFDSIHKILKADISSFYYRLEPSVADFLESYLHLSYLNPKGYEIILTLFEAEKCKYNSKIRTLQGLLAAVWAIGCDYFDIEMMKVLKNSNSAFKVYKKIKEFIRIWKPKETVDDDSDVLGGLEKNYENVYFYETREIFKYSPDIIYNILQKLREIQHRKKLVLETIQCMFMQTAILIDTLICYKRNSKDNSPNFYSSKAKPGIENYASHHAYNSRSRAYRSEFEYDTYNIVVLQSMNSGRSRIEFKKSDDNYDVDYDYKEELKNLLDPVFPFTRDKDVTSSSADDKEIFFKTRYENKSASVYDVFDIVSDSVRYKRGIDLQNISGAFQPSIFSYANLEKHIFDVLKYCLRESQPEYGLLFLDRCSKILLCYDNPKLDEMARKLKSLMKSIDTESRIHGWYYCVSIFGLKAEKGEHFIYHENSHLYELSARLEAYFSDIYGADKVNMIYDKRDPTNHEGKDPNLCNIQVVHVTPYRKLKAPYKLCISLPLRKNENVEITEFPIFNELNVEEYLRDDKAFWSNNYVSEFYFERPYTKDGKKQGSLEEQYIRKIVLKTESRMPGVTNRSEIIGSRVIEIEPIRFAYRQLKQRVIELDNAIINADITQISQILHGNLLSSVNDGPARIYKVFIDTNKKYNKKYVKKIIYAFDLFIKLNMKALLIHKKLHVEKQRVFERLQIELERGLEILKAEVKYKE